MKKYILTVVLCLALIATTFVAVGCDNDILPGDGNGSGIIWSQQDTGIWINGTGMVTVVPDVAILSLGVEVQAATVAIAQAQAAVDMDSVNSDPFSCWLSKLMSPCISCASFLEITRPRPVPPNFLSMVSSA